LGDISSGIERIHHSSKYLKILEESSTDTSQFEIFKDFGREQH
jgi:hypothetical protein